MACSYRNNQEIFSQGLDQQYCVIIVADFLCSFPLPENDFIFFIFRGGFPCVENTHTTSLTMSDSLRKIKTHNSWKVQIIL